MVVLTKIKLLVFIPLSACACTFSYFMDQFQKIIIPYKESFIFEVKDASSIEADHYEIYQSTVVMLNPPDQDTPLKFSSLNEFKKYLETNCEK